MSRKRAPSPGDLDRQHREACRREVDALWRRFSTEGPDRDEALISFAAYTTRDYLFCGYSGPQRLGALTLDQVKTFLLESAPSYFAVDDPRSFVEQTTTWLEWLLEHCDFDNRNEIARGLRRGAWRKDAVDKMKEEGGHASKELVLQARDAGIDLADLPAVLDYLDSLRPGDASWVEFVREFVDPPHPIFDRGRILYTYEWPPPDGEPG